MESGLFLKNVSSKFDNWPWPTANQRHPTGCCSRTINSREISQAVGDIVTMYRLLETHERHRIKGNTQPKEEGNVFYNLIKMWTPPEDVVDLLCHFTNKSITAGKCTLKARASQKTATIALLNLMSAGRWTAKDASLAGTTTQRHYLEVGEGPMTSARSPKSASYYLSLFFWLW